MTQRIEIVISSADQPDQKKWDEQRERIRRSGARFERLSRNWRLELDLSDASQVAASLAELCVAARNYGTTVLVLDPASGMPAMTVLSDSTAH